MSSLNRKLIFLIVFGVTLFFLNTLVFAVDDDIILNADSIVYDGIDNVIVAEGNVVATKKDDDVVLKSDKAFYYTKNKIIKLVKNIKVTKNKITLTCDLVTADFSNKTIRAQKNVKFTYEDITATSKEALYLLKEDKLSLIGNSTVWQKDDKLTGENIIIFIKSKRVQTEGRTKVILSPERLK
ncbi:MAG: LptA/OstA family protein [Candidatus Margulisiibacteriota bacterium]|jgi:lipopolysaccharide transport protein LptA